MHPCLDTFLRALPFAFREVGAEDGAAVTVAVSGEAGGEWSVVRAGGRWRQVLEGAARPTAKVSLGQDSAWKLFTKRVDRQVALARFPDVAIEGDRELGLHVLDVVSVMA
jgi:hypothetical protein